MNNNNNGNNGFVSGFVLGIVVGAVVVFLLATKKGKKLLKLLADEGLEGISELEEMLTEEFVEEKQPLKKTERKVELIPKLDEVQKSSDSSDSSLYIPRSLGRIQSSGRRFFRGIPKRG